MSPGTQAHYAMFRAKRIARHVARQPFRVFTLEQMLFLTNELAKKAEITILSAREKTRPVSWVERKGYITVSVARENHLGL